MDLTNTARKSPVGPHAPTFPLPASNYRNQPNDIWSAELNVRPPKVNICISILRDYSTSPKEWVEVLYFRSKAVLGLPVSTTSYSRHAVSIVQSLISTADNGTILNQHRRSYTFPVRPSISPSVHSEFNNYALKINAPYVSRVT